MTVQTIEKTSKKWKGWILACWGGLFFGVFMTWCGMGVSEVIEWMGFTLFILSIFGIVYVQVLIWWRHG